MEGPGGSEVGKEKKPWTTGTMIENRGKWNLEADIEVLGYIKNFSQNLLAETQSTLKSLDSLEAELNSTSVGIGTVANRFLSLADSQFVENRVYDDEETPGDETAVNDGVLNGGKTEDDDETEVLNKLKKSLINGIDVLNTKFEAVHVPDIDSEDDEDDDDDSALDGIVYRPINPFNSRPLPHIIGSKEFMSDPTVGLQEPPSEDEEGSLDEEESTSESKPAISERNDDSEPDSEFIDDRNKIIPPVQNQSDDIFGVGPEQGLSFAEHLAARLEGMKPDTKAARNDTPRDDSATIGSRQISVDINSQDNNRTADTYYDDGFDDPYDNYNDSIFGRSSRNIEDEAKDHEDLFVPKKKQRNNPITSSSLWDENEEPAYDSLNSKPNPNKKQLIQDLENALRKDTMASSSSSVTAKRNRQSSVSSSSPLNDKSAIAATKSSKDELFGDEQDDSLFAPKSVEAPKKKLPAGAVNVFGGNIDLFRNNLPNRVDAEKENSVKDEQVVRKDPAQKNFLPSEEEEDEDSLLFSSAVHNREKKSSSSKNSSVKLSDSFQDDTFSIISNKSSAGLLDEDPPIPPTKTLTKAMDDLFKDIDEDGDDEDDLFSSYLTANKNSRSNKQTSASDDLFYSDKPAAVSNKRNVSDDLFSDFKDDLFSSIAEKQNLQEESDVKKAPPRLKPSFGVSKKQNLFSDSDSDSEFLSTESTSNVFSKQSDSQKSTATSAGENKTAPSLGGSSKSLFGGSFGTDDDLFGNSGALVSSSQKASLQKPVVGKDEGDLFKVDEVKRTLGSDDVKVNPADDRRKKTQSNPISKTSRKPVSIFDQESSDEDDELFGTKSVQKITNTNDVLPETIKSKEILDETLDNKKATFSSSDYYNDCSDESRKSDGNSSLFNDTEPPKKSNSPPLFPEPKSDVFQNSRNNVNDLIIPQSEPPPLDDENIEADSNSDGIFRSNDSSVSSKITRETNEMLNNSLSENRSVEKLDNISSSVYVSNNDDSIFTRNISVPPLEKKSGRDSIVSSKNSGKSLFEDAEVENSSDIFRSIGKTGFKNKTENIFEKTATTSVPSLLSSKDDDDDDLFGSGIKELKDNLKSDNILSEEGPVEKVKKHVSTTDSLFNTEVTVDTVSDLSKPESIGPVENDKKADISNKPQPPVKPSLGYDSPKKTKQSSPKLPPVETKVSVKTDPLTKPVPPKSLNIRAPISAPDPFGQIKETVSDSSRRATVIDSTDGGIISSESKVKPPPPKVPGKLNLEKALNIDPKALLPGAQPKFKKQANNNENAVPENSSSVTESSESAVSPTGVLRNMNRDRAKIKAKRRPQTRKARREALRQSTADDDDETDNSSSNPTLSIVDQTTSSFEPSNILSPSTDEEDLFGVPPLDLPPDYTKVSTSPGDIFSAPATVLSPELSVKENIFDEKVREASLEGNKSVSAKATEKDGDIFASDDVKVKIIPERKSGGEAKGDLFSDDFNVPKPSSFAEESDQVEGDIFNDDFNFPKSASFTGKVDGDIFNDDFNVPKPPPDDQEEEDFDEKETGWSNDYEDDGGLFASRPTDMDVYEELKSEGNSEPKTKPEAKNLVCGVLNAGMNLCDKIAPVSQADDELFSSDWASKKETKVVSVQEKKSSGSLFGEGITSNEREDDVSDEIFLPKPTATSKTTNVSVQKKKTIVPEPSSLFGENVGNAEKIGEDSDDIFKPTPTVKPNSGSSSKKVSNDMFSDIDEDDLFGKIGAAAPPAAAAKSSDLLFAAKPKTGGKFSGKPSTTKSSLFADEDADGDEDGGDLFSSLKTNKTGLPSKERRHEKKDGSKSSSAKDSHNKLTSSASGKLSKDPHKPFVDPLSSLND